MYVPEGWWHGTLNGAPSSLSVAAQRRTGMTGLSASLPRANLEKNKGQNNKAFKSLRERSFLKTLKRGMC